jgi:uncharacterized protein (TIGR02246 family)
VPDVLGDLIDIEEIQQLKARYFRCIDTQDWEGFSTGVVAEDAHFDIVGHVVDGRDAIVAFVAESLRGATTVHHGHTPEITVTGADTATGIWAMYDYVTLPDPDGTQRVFHGYGHYHEEYVRTAAGWRIRSTVLSRLRVDTEIV